MTPHHRIKRYQNDTNEYQISFLPSLFFGLQELFKNIPAPLIISIYQIIGSGCVASFKMHTCKWVRVYACTVEEMQSVTFTEKLLCSLQRDQLRFFQITIGSGEIRKQRNVKNN